MCQTTEDANNKTEDSVSGQEQIEFCPVSDKITGESDPELARKIEEDAEATIRERKDKWKRYTGHLVFFQKSDCTSYVIIHAPLIVLDGGKSEVIGVLTIENKLDATGKVTPQLFSEHEITLFKHWANISRAPFRRRRTESFSGRSWIIRLKASFLAMFPGTY